MRRAVNETGRSGISKVKRPELEADHCVHLFLHVRVYFHSPVRLADVLTLSTSLPTVAINVLVNVGRAAFERNSVGYVRGRAACEASSATWNLVPSQHLL
jgi:hypothetical protein